MSDRTTRETMEALSALQDHIAIFQGYKHLLAEHIACGAPLAVPAEALHRKIAEQANTIAYMALRMQQTVSPGHSPHVNFVHVSKPKLEADERMIEGLRKIEAWADAYPAEQFPDQNLEAIDALLREHGYSMTALHGQWARRLVAGIGKIAHEALWEDD